MSKKKPTVVPAESGVSLSEIAAAIRALDPKGEVVQFDENGYISYSGVAAGRLFRADTAEEHTRAFIVAYMVKKLGYAPACLRLEHRVRARVGRDGADKWCDLTLSRNAGIHYLMEIKSPEQWHAEKADAVEGQLFGLAPFCRPRPAYLVYATVERRRKGGLGVLCEIIDGAHNSHAEWEKAGGRIAGRELKAGWTPPEKRNYVCGGENDLVVDVRAGELTHIRRSLHNVLWGGGGTADTDVFNFLVRLLLAKIQDELDTPQGESYHVQDNADVKTILARAESRYQNALVSRIGYSEGAAREKRIISGAEISDDKFIYAVNRIERLNFSRIAETPGARDIMGDFFEGIMRAGFKQTKGQFFTHPNIIRFLIYALGMDAMTVNMINSSAPALPAVIDPSAGSGAFLVESMKAVTRAAREGDIKKTQQAENFIKDNFDRPRAFSWAENYFVGMELNAHLGLAAQVNMVLHSDGSSAMLAGEHGNGLAPLSSYRSVVSPVRGNGGMNYEKPVSEKFDAVVTNPPFSVAFPAQGRNRAALHENFTLANESSQALFLERWFQLLKPGGRLGVVLPNSVFDGRGAGAARVRAFLLRYFNVKAVVALPTEAFQPYTPTKTSLMVAEKKTPEEQAAAADIDDIGELLANNGGIIFKEAVHLGFERTTRKETRTGKNDLYQTREDGETVAPDKGGFLRDLRKNIKWQTKTAASPAILSGSNLGRMDAECNLWASSIPARHRAPFTDYFDIVQSPSPKESELSKRIKYCEIGDVSAYDSAMPQLVDISAAEGDDENARLAQKIIRGDIIKPRAGDIIVAKVRVYLGKILSVRSDDVYFTKAFVTLRPKKPGDMYYALLRWHFLPMLTAYSRWGMAYPTLAKDDLRSAVVDRREAENFLKNGGIRANVRKMRELLKTLESAQKQIAEVAGELSR